MKVRLSIGKMKSFLTKIFALLLFLCMIGLCQYPCLAQTAVVFHGDRDGCRIALTFDDGPHPIYTEKILSLLQQYHIKATFFVIGENLEYYPQAAKALVQAGHEIGNHTFTHGEIRKLSTAELKKEIQQTEQALKKLNVKSVHLFRPPCGYRTDAQNRMVHDMGYQTVLWSIDTEDWAHTPPDQIVRRVKESIKGGDILLFHDYVCKPNTTIAALEVLIPELQKSGYEFVTVSELLDQTPSEVSTGSSGCSSK